MAVVCRGRLWFETEAPSLKSSFENLIVDPCGISERFLAKDI